MFNSAWTWHWEILKKYFPLLSFGSLRYFGNFLTLRWNFWISFHIKWLYLQSCFHCFHQNLNSSHHRSVICSCRDRRCRRHLHRECLHCKNVVPISNFILIRMKSFLLKSSETWKDVFRATMYLIKSWKGTKNDKIVGTTLWLAHSVLMPTS